MAGYPTDGARNPATLLIYVIAISASLQCFSLGLRAAVPAAILPLTPRQPTSLIPNELIKSISIKTPSVMFSCHKLNSRSLLLSSAKNKKTWRSGSSLSIKAEGFSSKSCTMSTTLHIEGYIDQTTARLLTLDTQKTLIGAIVSMFNQIATCSHERDIIDTHEHETTPQDATFRPLPTRLLCHVRHSLHTTTSFSSNMKPRTAS